MKYPSINQSNVFVLNCMHCSFHTLLLSSLQEHIRDVHPNLDCYYSLYQCEHCGIISTSSNLLIEHTSLMHGDKQASVTCIYQGNNEPEAVTAFTCVFCEHTSGSPADMTLHYSNFHGVRNVSPIHLKTRALGISTAAASRNRNNRGDTKGEGKSVESNRQVVDVGMNGSLTEAATRELADAENGNGHWKCRNCGKEYDKKKYFVEHMIACVKSMKLVCVCGRTCKWRSNFYAHRKRCPVYNSQFPKVDNKRETVRSGMVFSPTGQLIGIRTGGPLMAQAAPTLFPLTSTALVNTTLTDPSHLQVATTLGVNVKPESNETSVAAPQAASLYYTQLQAPTITDVSSSSAM